MSTPRLLGLFKWLALAALGAGSGMAFADSALAPQTPDPRQVHDQQATPWMSAIGQLQVPGIRYRDGHRRHHREDCSATLIGQKDAENSAFIMTAWHCLADYRDLSQRITFTLQPGSATSRTLEAVRVTDGGGMHADWAVLRLLENVPRTEVKPLTLGDDRGDPARNIQMAGYSRDAGIGNHGSRLTYDPACRITAQLRGRTESDCTAHKGASGGAVVQPAAGLQPELLGVISEGNGTDLSIYVPATVFRRVVESYMSQ